MADQPQHDEFFTGDDLRSIGSDYLRTKKEEPARHAAVLAEAKRKVIEEMRQPVTVTDEMRRRFLNRLKDAAASGQTSLQVIASRATSAPTRAAPSMRVAPTGRRRSTVGRSSSSRSGRRSCSRAATG